MTLAVHQDAGPGQRLRRARRHAPARRRSTPAQIRALADRRFGVGCDQVLVVEPADARDVDFRYRIFNADGGEVEQCGNGARCFVVFVRDKGSPTSARSASRPRAGIIVPRLEDDGEVTVDMGVPRFRAADDSVHRRHGRGRRAARRRRRRRSQISRAVDGQSARGAGRRRRRRRAGDHAGSRASSAIRASRSA